MKAKHWIGIGVLALLGLAATLKLVGVLESGAYRAPLAPPAQLEQAPTPRDEALEEIAAAEAAEAATRPYEQPEYRQIGNIPSRVIVWVVAQLHLLFAAFVLAVPMFALVIEAVGYFTGDKRYDRLAYEFTKLLSVSFSLTATFGAFLTFVLVILYPKFTTYLMNVFSPTFLPYVLLFFAEAFFLYTYYYGWGKFHPVVHLSLGLGLNVVGTAIMFIANAWLSFQMSPAGVSSAGAVTDIWAAINNYTWMPINIHRVIANVAFGGSVAAAYAAWQFLNAKSDEQRAHYDWMGYTGNLIAVCAFLPLPFAGYWLASEIYAYNQALGIMMMGGIFSWLFMVQAVLIGLIFLAANYYLWVGMGRVEGETRYRGAIKWLAAAIAICIGVWATPRAIPASAAEVREMGATFHPMLRWLGLMSAKNTAVNILILATFVTFILYLRSGKKPTASWANFGNWLQTALVAGAGGIVVFLGIHGYFVEASVRIRYSVYMVGVVAIAMVGAAIVNIFMQRGAIVTGKTRWGHMPAISQYALIFIAVSFTWLMGLMGYVRSGLRQHWHVYGVIRDNSVDAYTPALGFATKVVSVTVLIFFGLIAFVFWLASLSGKQAWEAAPERVRGGSGAPTDAPSPVGALQADSRTDTGAS